MLILDIEAVNVDINVGLPATPCHASAEIGIDVNLGRESGSEVKRVVINVAAVVDTALNTVER